MNFLKEAGVYRTIIDKVTFSHHDEEVRELVAQGKRTPFINLAVSTKKGQANIKLWLPKPADDQTKAAGKRERLSKFLWAFDDNLDQEFSLKIVEKKFKAIEGKEFEGLFRTKEYLKYKDDKIFLNTTTEFAWGRKEGDNIQFTQDQLIRKLNDQDQKIWNDYQAQFKSSSRSSQNATEIDMSGFDYGETKEPLGAGGVPESWHTDESEAEDDLPF